MYFPRAQLAKYGIDSNPGMVGRRRRFWLAASPRRFMFTTREEPDQGASNIFVGLANTPPKPYKSGFAKPNKSWNRKDEKLERRKP